MFINYFDAMFAVTAMVGLSVYSFAYSTLISGVWGNERELGRWALGLDRVGVRIGKTAGKLTLAVVVGALVLFDWYLSALAATIVAVSLVIMQSVNDTVTDSYLNGDSPHIRRARKSGRPMATRH